MRVEQLSTLNDRICIGSVRSRSLIDRIRAARSWDELAQRFDNNYPKGTNDVESH